MDLSQICRLCRRQCDPCANLITLSGYRSDVKIVELIGKVCFDVSIEEFDGLPQQICEECLEILISAYRLQQESIKSDEYFRSKYSEPEVKIKQETLELLQAIKVEEKEPIEEHLFVETFAEPVTNSFQVGLIESDEDDSQYIEDSARKFKGPLSARALPGSSGLLYKDVYYKCNFCSIELKPRLNMMRHLELKHDPILKPYGCKFCLLRFDEESRQKIHEEEKHLDDEQPAIIFCKQCNASGNSSDGMKRHIVDDHAEKIVNRSTSDPMESEYDEEEESDEHKKRFRYIPFKPRALNESTNYEEVWYICSFCPVKLKPRKVMLRHMKELHDPKKKPYFCQYCIQRFKSDNERIKHKKKFHSNAKQRQSILICDICGATGSSAAGIVYHKANDHYVTAEEENIKNEIEVVDHSIPEIRIRRKSEILFHPRPVEGYEHLSRDEILYQCNFCENQYHTRSKTVRHIRSQHDPIDFPFGCQFCIQRFASSAELEYHESSSHDNEAIPTIFVCPTCNVSGDNAQGMSNHINDDHENVSKYECDRCGFLYLHKKRLISHFKKEHLKENPKFYCFECKIGFKSWSSHQKHNNIAHQGDFRCRHCTSFFKTKKEMKVHSILHMDLIRPVEPHEIVQEFLCVICQQEYSSKKEVINHMQSHESKFGYGKCIMCPARMKTWTNALDHSSYHCQPKTHECLSCNRKFPMDEKLLLHVQGHENRKKPSYYSIMCNKCGTKWRSSKDLETHEKAKHQNLTLFVCPTCGKSLSSENNLKQHMTYVHMTEEEKKFECKLCSRRFPNKFKLNRHEIIHSSARPYVCEVEGCNASFKQQEGLALHTKRHDGTIVKKHQCTQCHLKFMTAHRLANHMLTHTGAKPHECEYCTDRAYASKGDLMKHLQKVHLGDAIYKCNIEGCTQAFRLKVQLQEHYRDHAN